MEESKQRRGTRGDGCIQNVGRNKWRVMVDFGTNPVTKKRERVSRVVNGTKADARRVRDELRRERESGLTFEGATATFGEFADRWEASRADGGKVARTALAREHQMLRDMESYIGDVRLRDITPQMVESLYAAIRRDKSEGRGEPLSETTLNMYHRKLKQVMKRAVDYDLILRNPCDRVEAPKCDDPKRHSLSAEDGARLLQFVDDAEAEAYEWMDGKEARQTAWGNLFGRSSLLGINTLGYIEAVRVGLATGMRRGEILGLCWGSVDFDRRCIRVRQSLTTYGEVKPPKSKAGVRTVAMDAATAAHLARWKSRQSVELLKIGVKQGDETPVCCSTVGGFAETQRFAKWWREFREHAGFSDLKFHELRHTQATQLLANGVDVKTVQARLGHANASVTLNMYAHAVPENDIKAAELVGNLFAKEPETAKIIELKTA